MNNPFGKIYVELDNKLTNITDLKRDQYELFLNLTAALNLTYRACIQAEKRSKKIKEDSHEE